jgi:D-alanyl-D-alanine carboxypeptidase
MLKNKKVYYSIILLFSFSYCSLFAEAYHADAIGIFDLKNNQYLYKKNILKKRAPASTIKVLTALTAWANAKDINAYVTVSARAAAAQPTKAGLLKGERFRIVDLIKTCLVASCNDAASALAEGVAGSEYAFSLKMQKFANQIGCRQTTVTNASGLPKPKGMTSSINDSIKIFKVLLKNKYLCKMSRVKAFNLVSAKGRKIYLGNHNRLLKGFEYDVIGKTGYTILAQHCFLSAGFSKDKEVIVSILGNQKKYLWGDLKSAYRRHLSGKLYLPRFMVSNKISLGTLHKLLEKKGYKLSKSEKIYGIYTRQAVKRFQVDRRLSVDGIIGPITWKALNQN